MARTGDYGGGAKILVWIGSFAIAVGAMYGIRKWRDHATRKDGALDKAQDVRGTWGDFVRCLGGYDVLDVRSTVAFRAAEGDLASSNDCLDYANRTVTQLETLERLLDVGGSPHEQFKLDDLASAGALDRFCKSYDNISERIEHIVDVAGGHRMDASRCDGGQRDSLTLVTSPWTGPAQLTVGDALLATQSIDGEHFSLARTVDGTKWERQETPGGKIRSWSWTEAGLAVGVTDAAGYQTFVADSGSWQSRAVLKGTGYLEAMTMTQSGAVATLSDQNTQMAYVVRSTDGAKTFGAPIKLRAREEGEIHWDVATYVRGDGRVVIESAPNDGRARFVASVLEPNAKAPRPTAQFDVDPGPGPMMSCNDGDTMWAIVRGRNVVYSRDAGRSWDVRGLPDAVTAPIVSCTKDRIAIADVKANMFYTCDLGDVCRSSAFPIKDHGLVGIRLEPVVELWLAPERFNEPQPLTVLAYRFEEGSFARGTTHTFDTARKVPAVLDAGKFITLTNF